MASRPDDAADAGAGSIFGVARLLRRLPIRGRIFALAAINTLAVLVLLLLLFDGAQVLNRSWSELRQVRNSDRVLGDVENEAGRLQSLIHRYFTQPNPDVLAEIERRRKDLSDSLARTGDVDASLARSSRSLAAITDRLLAGFDDLRRIRTTISDIYEGEVLQTAREIAGLYSIIESTLQGAESLVRPTLGKSREAFSTALVAANAYYLSLSANSAQEASRSLDTIAQTVPVMVDLAESDLQRAALKALEARVLRLKEAMLKLSQAFEKQKSLLRDVVDQSQSEMTEAVATLTGRIRARETQVQGELDRALSDLFRKAAFVSVAFLAIVAVIGVATAQTISRPLTALMNAMAAIVHGRLDRPVAGVAARDEIGAMARSIEVFRGNALAKKRAEEELRAAKEHAELAFSELRDTQRNLIEAEKLAALGGLVAGVAHEVNNPVGISLTVASSLARRCDDFERELASGELRRSRLKEFAAGNREAANQLVANLHRAGELIQSFKQVAVDRSHAERRSFDLRQATEQIIASLRPGLSKKRLGLIFECPPGIVMDSYPGAYGQVLTNLFLNAVTHAFAAGQEGAVRIAIEPQGPSHVRIEFADDGAGMSEDVRRRAFDPFFTTLRGQGGTGLGLHIVYNIVTGKLGGRIALTSEPGAGTIFRMLLPLVAPRDEAARAPAAA